MHLARVEKIGAAGARHRWRLHVPLLGDEHGPFDARALSFLSIETRERVPLRVLSLNDVGGAPDARALLIDVEPLDLSGRLPMQAVLVEIRSAPVEAGRVPAPSQVVSSIDYLARDFDSFRTLLLNRITSLAPTWKDRTRADLGVMLTEVLAYLADNLTYYQDAVATEAYLQTARRRMSVRRHGRLLAYWLDQGVGARVWVRFDARTSITVPRGTKLLASPGGQAVVQVGTVQYTQQRARATAVFETMMELDVHPELGEIDIWDHDRRHFVIPAGSTSVVVEGRNALKNLKVGAVLLFESRTSADIAPQLVRITRRRRAAGGRLELHWSQEDALLNDVPVTRTVAGVVEKKLSVLRGNVVLADFGESTTSVLPIRTDIDAPYEPLLPYSIVSLSASPPTSSTPAALCTVISRDQICPAIELDEHRDLLYLAGETTTERPRADAGANAPRERTWTPVPDLLLSGPYSPVFVVEMHEEGCSLRFGDGVFGLAPPLGSVFTARFRIGNTATSNVGVRAISTIVAPTHHDWFTMALRVSNPVAATGGRGEETLAHAKQTAPALVHEVHAAITLQDYATIAMRVSGVAEAVALLLWTGSWFTTFVHVRAAPSAPPDVLLRVEQELAPARVAGRAIVVREPSWVALAVTLSVHLSAGFDRATVGAALREAFVAARAGEVQAGFFDPSRWRFGETVWASAVVTWAEGVRGVASAELVRFARVRDSVGGAEVPDKLEMARSELPQVLDEAFHPQAGTIVFEFFGDEEIWA
ncbi:hypothetical protein WMF04_23880 [Sorangium sp. So ce260]|uniref:hypothetical protein n=1 Tax=Sorangium sp. So ce260 TaxID=3133291 RepID=UPI003F5DDEBF